MNYHDIIGVPDHFKFLSTLSSDQLRSVVPSFRVRRVAKNEPIYSEREPARYVYLIEKGIVRLSRTSDDGRSVTLSIQNAGDLFGEMALVGYPYYTDTAEAMRPSTILTIPTAAVEAIMEENSRIAVLVTWIVGIRRLQIEDMLSNLMASVPVRLARLLLRLAESYPGQTNQGYRTINVRLTHRDLGELIGANRETVTATLNRFRRDGMIDAQDFTVILRDDRKLSTLAGVSRVVEDD